MKGGDYKWSFSLMKGGDYALGTMRWRLSMNNALSTLLTLIK